MKSNLRFISSASIAELKYVGPATEPLAEGAPLPPIDREALLKKEELALEKAYRLASHIGVGVTPEAQRIFDAMVKTLPCQWAGQVIVVLDTVHISPPYTVENVAGTAGAGDTLARVKQMLEVYRKRIASGTA